MYSRLMKIMDGFWLMIFFVSLTHVIPSSSSAISFESSRRSPVDNSSIDYRLPDNIIPIAYKIMLNPNFRNKIFEFTGNSEIHIKINKPTTKITLHSMNLIIHSNVSLKCDYDINNIEILKIDIINSKELLNIILNRELPADTHCNLTLNYHGRGNQYPRGFYRTSYVNTKWKREWIASTNFQLTNARSTFPCWDEPDLKANFLISIKHNKTDIALSNTYEVMREIDSESVITHFAETPKISTYSVGFTIGKLDLVDADDQLRIWIQQNYTKYAKHMLNITQKLVITLENYTNFSYKDLGLEKLDSILLPVRGNQMTMENSGLINYQLQSLAINENTTSVIRYEYATHIIAFQLACQWFGHLITANWYNNLWLSRGIAHYLEYALTDQIEPSWRNMDMFVVNNLQSVAFTIDSKIDSPAIEQTKNILKNKGIESINKIITVKASSIIRTVSYILGEEKLKIALQNYLRIHAFGSVTSENLFHELAKIEINNKNLTEILRNWVRVPGYPLVTVNRDYNNGKAIITQMRFLNNVNTTSNAKYWIPINFVIENNLNFTDTNVTHWLHPAIHSIEINDLQNDEFIILNKQQFGYYRVNYDKTNWNLIINYLLTNNHTDIHVLNRAQLIDDAFNLAKVNILGYDVFLSLIEYLKYEEDYIPWSAAWKGIAHIYKFVENTDYATKFKQYIEELSIHLLNVVQLTKSNEINSITKFRRFSALKNSCFFGSSLCRAQAASRLYEFLFEDKKNTESNEETEWILREGIRESNETVWNKLWDEYLKNTNRDLSKFINSAVGCSSNGTISKLYLSKMLKYNSYDSAFFMFFDTVGDCSDTGFETVVEFIIENYKTIKQLYGINSDYLQNYFTSVGKKFKSRIYYDKMSQLIETNKEKLNGIADGLLVAIKNNLETVDEPLNQIIKFFINREGNDMISKFDKYIDE